ncbi:Calcium-binding EF hand family protein [Rhynchospora pubera]|uniref:Calcium-binding EF hand family protein n=1 Tax=Rhynchospora pubera TaxID=906938 RepID=A0AAV8EZ25_9POAL|nr:Calcium-binding EF hand family protein [Rhynchospora pubera]
MEAFENYFRRADLNQDGRISGSEAVSFFQGFGLPQQVLAQIWMYADQSKSGFLGRPEFFNALRMVTVAQTGRALTPEIVKAALYGPAASKIPPPQLKSAGTTPAPQVTPSPSPTPQIANTAVPTSGQMGSLNPAQYTGARAPQVTSPNLGLSQQMVPSSTSTMRPPQATLVPSPSPLQAPGHNAGLAAPVQGVSPSPLQGAGVRPGLGAPVPASSASPLQALGVNQGLGSRPPSPSPSPLQALSATQGLAGGSTVPGPRLATSGSLELSTDWLSDKTGGAQSRPASAPSGSIDVFGLSALSNTMGATTRPQAQPTPASSIPPKPQDPFLSSFAQPVRSAPDLRSLGLSQSGLSSSTSGFGNDSSVQPKSSVLSGTTTTPSSSPQISFAQLDPLKSVTSTGTSSNQVPQTQAQASAAGALGMGSGQPQPNWPKMTKADVNKYTKVFHEVDKDRDGRITGMEARNLFLSWKLPREILKQVWDLSDQDNDGMLTLREFCIALYLMERHRQGSTLPKSLPDSLRYDEALLQATGLPASAYAGPTWQQNPGMANRVPGAVVVPGMGATRPPLPGHVHPHMKAGQTKLSMPGMDNNHNAVNRDAPVPIAPEPQDAASVDKKAPEKLILDSKEKIEYYRTKMQELVLYKSRCDNRLNEITERASSDKREVESLGKKYEEKYKQVGEIASKLAVEEAAIRDVHERKTELENAIVKMEQGGSADGLLQVRADRIQYQLEELERALAERCKHFGVSVSQSASVELPFGWEPGAPEGAMDWDEDWDKFEDEGFMVVKANTTEVEHVPPSETKTPSLWNDDESLVDGFSPTSSNGHHKNGRRFSVADSELNYDQSEESLASPGGRSTFESPFVSSPRIKDDLSDRDGAESSIFGDKFADGPSWNFDDTDTDSVWGANTMDTDNQRNSFFTSGDDFGLNPIRTESPSASSVYGKKKSSFFDDSVPSSPAFSATGFSPKFNDNTSFNYGRFDSFKTEDSGFFPQDSNRLSRFDSMASSKGDTLSRFDSMRSSADFGHRRTFDSFDDNDPFGSTGPFKASGSPPRF